VGQIHYSSQAIQNTRRKQINFKYIPTDNSNFITLPITRRR
jgi:hypothetical protein